MSAWRECSLLIPFLNNIIRLSFFLVFSRECGLFTEWDTILCCAYTLVTFLIWYKILIYWFWAFLCRLSSGCHSGIICVQNSNAQYVVELLSRSWSYRSTHSSCRVATVPWQTEDVTKSIIRPTQFPKQPLNTGPPESYVRHILRTLHTVTNKHVFTNSCFISTTFFRSFITKLTF